MLRSRLPLTTSRGFRKTKFGTPKKERGFKHEWDAENMPVHEYGSEKSYRKIFAWGLAASGALGNREFVQPIKHTAPLKDCRQPCVVRFKDDNKITAVAAGFGFSLFAQNTKERHNKILGCGLNTNSQLGFHPLKKSQSESRQWLVEPTPVSLPLLTPEKTRVTHIAAGRVHSVIATDLEGIFTLGNNATGQCGRPVIENESYENNTVVHKIDCIQDPVKQLVCGLDHTLVLTETGKVYTFGCNADGQLGNGSYEFNHMPRLVQGDIANENIVHLSCAADTILACSDKGDVFGWGNSEYHQLNSVTTEMQVSVPQHLPLKFNDKRAKVVKTAASGSACAVLTDQGLVFVWGFGILGQGPAVEQRKAPVELPQPLFGINEFAKDVKVTDIAAGVHNFAAVTNTGDLYTWGKNRCGMLGLGHDKDQYFPFKVCIACNVQQISIGPDHSVALCRTWV